MQTKPNLSYFLGANSQSGFFSYFDQLIDLKTADHLYVIKGGPGTGKSSFMKRLAAAANARGVETELAYCSSDPDSLDAVFFPSLKTAFVDGTAPHVVDPVYPGAADSIINMGEFWDKSKLRRHRDEIIAISDEISAAFKKAYRFIGAAGFVCRDSSCAFSPAADADKLDRFVERRAKKLFPEKRAARGRDVKRFLSGITPKGFICYFDEFAASCGELCVIEDKCGASYMLLSRLKDAARSAGYDTVSYYCPMNPSKLEHLYIPETGSGFVTSDSFHPYEGPYDRRIYSSRFIVSSLPSDSRGRVKFNKKCEKSLLAGAISSLAEAKALHDELEKHYVGAMDFEQSDRLADRLISEIFR